MEKQTLQEFKNNVGLFDKKMMKHYSGIDVKDDKRKQFYETEERKLIHDGIVNIEEYYNCDTKILWILKEPYCGNDNKGGGWSLVKNLNDERATGKNRTSFQTFDKIIYTSSCIINNVRYDDLYHKVNIKDLSIILRKIAYINVQKLPATKNSNNDLISQNLTEHVQILVDQINTIQPQIIIDCSGQGVKEKIENQLDKSILFAKSYHPAYRRRGQEEFVNRLLEQLKR